MRESSREVTLQEKVIVRKLPRQEGRMPSRDRLARRQPSREWVAEEAGHQRKAGREDSQHAGKVIDKGTEQGKVNRNEEGTLAETSGPTTASE